MDMGRAAMEPGRDRVRSDALLDALLIVAGSPLRAELADALSAHPSAVAAVRAYEDDPRSRVTRRRVRAALAVAIEDPETRARVATVLTRAIGPTTRRRRLVSFFTERSSTLRDLVFRRMQPLGIDDPRPGKRKKASRNPGAGDVLDGAASGRSRRPRPGGRKKPSTPANGDGASGSSAHGNAAQGNGGSNGTGSTGDGAPPPAGHGDTEVAAVLEARATKPPVVRVPVEVIVDIRPPAADEDDATPGAFRTTFPPGRNRIPLRVQLTSTAFDIDDPERPIVLRRDGTAERPARFQVTARRAGSHQLTATLHQHANLIAQVSFRVDVASAADATTTPIVTPADPDNPATSALIPIASVGRALDAVQITTARDISISLRMDGGRLTCVVLGAAALEADLEITPADLQASVDEVRDSLENLVKAAPFQSTVRIDGPTGDAALEPLAQAGMRLFQQLFFRSTANRNAAAIGDLLIAELGQTEGRRVQFATRGLAIPWQTLYLARDRTAPLSWDRFLGMAHDIEELVINAPRSDARIAGDEPLSVGLHFDEKIDQAQGLPAVANQKQFWDEVKRGAPTLTTTRRTRRDQLLSALGPRARRQHLLYFLCHAGAGTTSDGAPAPDRAWLRLSDQQPVTVGELHTHASTATPLRANPVVFLNACESAEMSPQFYVNFASYFLDRGARTVIGTECKVPTVFADAFARMVLTEVLSGMPIGGAMLAARREMRGGGNPLGLAYGLHGDGDAHIAPPLLAPAPVGG